MNVSSDSLQELQDQIKDLGDLKTKLKTISVTKLLEILIAGALKTRASYLPCCCMYALKDKAALHQLGSTLRTVGEIFVAFAALRVHHRVLNEHVIDEVATKIMKKEQVLGVLGIALIIGGHILETVARLGVI